MFLRWDSSMYISSFINENKIQNAQICPYHPHPAHIQVCMSQCANTMHACAHMHTHTYTAHRANFNYVIHPEVTRVGCSNRKTMKNTLNLKLNRWFTTVGVRTANIKEIHPSIHSFINESVINKRNPSIHPFINKSVINKRNQSIHPFINESVINKRNPSIHPSIHQWISNQ